MRYIIEVFKKLDTANIYALRRTCVEAANVKEAYEIGRLELHPLSHQKLVAYLQVSESD